MHSNPLRIKRIFSGCCLDDIRHLSLITEDGNLIIKTWDEHYYRLKNNNSKKKTLRTWRKGK